MLCVNIYSGIVRSQDVIPDNKYKLERIIKNSARLDSSGRVP